MCIGCWNEAGRPFEDTRRVRAAIPLWQQADPFGDLHIIIDDNNLDDDQIIWCRDEWCPKNQNLPSDIELCNRLLEMSMAERWALYWLADQTDFDPKAA